MSTLIMCKSWQRKALIIYLYTCSDPSNVSTLRDILHYAQLNASKNQVIHSSNSGKIQTYRERLQHSLYIFSVSMAAHLILPNDTSDA